MSAGKVDQNPYRLSPAMPSEKSPISPLVLRQIAARADAEVQAQEDWEEAIKPTTVSAIGNVRQLGGTPLQARALLSNTTAGAGVPIAGVGIPGGVVGDWVPRIAVEEPVEVRKGVVPSVGLLLQTVPTDFPVDFLDQEVNDYNMFLLIDRKYIELSTITPEWLPGGIPLIPTYFPSVGAVDVYAETLVDEGVDLSFDTYAPGTGGVIPGDRFYRWLGFAAKGTATTTASVIADETGDEVYAAAFFNSLDVYQYEEPQNFASAAAYIENGPGSDSATGTGSFNVTYKPRTKPPASNIGTATVYVEHYGEGGGDGNITWQRLTQIRDFYIIPSHGIGRYWSYIDDKGWIVWFSVWYGSYLDLSIDFTGTIRNVRYYEERIYGFSGKKNIQRRKVYARRYYDDGTSQYAEGQALEDLVFSPTPVTLEDFRDNPKSVNLEWGATVTPPVSPDECLNDYQTDRLLNYLPTRRKAYDPPTFGTINASIISGDPLTIEGYRVSSTSPTCDLVPDREYQQRIQAWADSEFGSDPESADNPPVVLTFAYYAP